MRRWCAIAACVSAVFCVYIGLVPFRFVWPEGVSIVETFRLTAEHDIGSRANFLANILLAMPAGFFGAGFFVGRTTKLLRVVAGLVILALASGALSLAVEIVQVLLPSRTPSLTDIVAQVTGTTIGAACWMAVRRDVFRLAQRHRSGDVQPVETCLWAYLVLRTLGLVLPLNVSVNVTTLMNKYRRGMIVLDPLQSAGRPGFFQDAAAEIVLTVPIGLLAYIVAARTGARRPLAVAIALGVCFCAATELAQVFVMSRTADLADVLTGTIGSLAGAVAGAKFLRVDAAAKPAERDRSWAMIGILISLAVYAAYNLSPFDFSRPADAGTRAAMLFQLPFYSYYDGSELESVRGAILKVLLAVPVGVFVAMAAAPLLRRYPRIVTAFVLLLGAFFFLAVEAGQVLLPSRYPDDTDVVLAVGGLWAGLVMVRSAWKIPRHE